MLRKQGVRYLLVGGYNTVFGYAVFAVANVLLGDSIHYLFLLVGATLVAILNNYVTYRLLVFRVEGSWLLDLGRFSVVYLVALLVNLPLLPLLVALGLPVLLAQALIVVGTVVASFFAHRHFSFRRSPAEVGEPSA